MGESTSTATMMATRRVTLCLRVLRTGVYTHASHHRFWTQLPSAEPTGRFLSATNDSEGGFWHVRLGILGAGRSIDPDEDAI